ncbi:hypothetical protein niasHT_024828 [Heterodera trifolii]|uniref:Uncharacterized protein n=1 Tax=Heterodera trifolii TaxID=157864 RepID=A0ABD2KGA7_9BILA
MSSHYRSQIKRVCEEAADVLSDQKIFQIPARPQGTPDNVFFISVQTRLKPLNDEMEDVNEVISELSCAADKWMTLRSSMTGAERAVDNPLYDTFVTETNYHLVLSDLRKYFKTLRTQKRDLEADIPAQAPRVPNPPPAAPLMHLPKAELPTFAGDCTTYTSFWNSFKIGVHDLSIPDSIKFTYLKQCLSGPPLALVNSLPISDLSYNSALDLLTKTYDNPDEIARALHNLLRKLPHVRGGDNFCIDLRSLIDQFESICIQMGQKNLEYDTVNFQMAIEERLPRFVLDEIFMAKESNDNWTIDLLKEKLRAILKRKEQIHSISPKIHSAPKSKPFPSFSNSSFSPSTDPSALTFHSQISAVPSLPVTPTPLIPNATPNPNNEPSTDSDHNRQTNTSTITSPPMSVRKAPILLKCVRLGNILEMPSLPLSFNNPIFASNLQIRPSPQITLL